MGPQLLQEHAFGGAQLLVDLVPADPGDVVALRVEEQVLEQRLRALGRRRLTGPELAVDVLESFLLGLDVILVQGVLDGRGAVEELQDVLGAESERLQEDGHVLPALAVDPDPDGVLLVDVELEPRTPATG